MYDEDEIADLVLAEFDNVAGEIGRRQGGRRFGRALGAILTGGGSEAIRRRRRRGRDDDGGGRSAIKPNLSQQVAARKAVQQAEMDALGFQPARDFSGLFGIAPVSVPALGSAQSASTAQEPTQIHRLILQAIDPTGTIQPTDAQGWMGVRDIRLGVQSIFSNVQPVSLAALQNVATLSGLSTRIITPGQQLTIDYVNNHPTLALTVSGAGFGPTPS